MTRPPKLPAPPPAPQGPVSFNAPMRRTSPQHPPSPAPTSPAPTSPAPIEAAAQASPDPAAPPPHREPVAIPAAETSDDAPSPAQAPAGQPSPDTGPSLPDPAAAAAAPAPAEPPGTDHAPIMQALPEGPEADPQPHCSAAAAPQPSPGSAKAEAADAPAAAKPAPRTPADPAGDARPPAKSKPRKAQQAPDAPDLPAGSEPRGERIAKWLARAGVASRRDAERLIEDGAIRLNGQPVAHPATFITPDDIVQVRGKVVDAPDRTRLWRYHKPEGLVTTHKDPQDRPTVFQKLPPTLPRVVSIGRLDLNSEGLLLLTNDGALARRLELPANGWLRRYRVRVYGNVDPRTLAALSQGVTVEGVRYGPIEAALEVRTTANSWLSVSLREGRNREIRKVMTHLNLQVTRLIRVAYGPFQLGNLERGGVDEITGKVLRDQLSSVPSPSGVKP